MKDLTFALSLAAAALVVPGLASAEAANEGDGTDGEIIVTAERLRGAVDAPQPPIATIDEAGIAALGASSLAELIAQISPQTGSGRGRGDGQSAILVNGQRVTGFREIRNFPPEAIRRVEVLPEEVALRYGFPPDARVINFILKDNFVSRIVEVDYGMPDRGGSRTIEGELSMLRITGPNRLNITATIDDTTPLTEAERGVIQNPGPATAPDPAAFRTLIADSRNLGLNLSWSRGLGKDGLGGQLSLNANLTRTDSISLSGLDALLAALERRTRTTSLSSGAGYSRALGPWQLTATLDATHSEGRTLIDRFDATGTDRAISNTERLTSLATLAGRPLDLPGGEVSTTLKAGYNWSNIVSSDTRSGAGAVDLTRGRVVTGVNLGVPITSRRENFLGGIGDTSLNFSADYDHLSDFGALLGWSAGLTWAPTGKLGLQASYIAAEAAPSLSQLGNPRTETFNVPVYDFTRGETVLATVIGGGNPALVRERQRDLKLGANWQLPLLRNSNLVAEYFRNRSNQVSAAFPLLTPAIEAAFPGRVVRDGTGRIVSVDERPVTFAEQTGSRLRWGLNLSGNLGPTPPDGAGRPGGPAVGGRPPGGGRMSMGAMMRGGQSRWNLGLFHTVQFDSQVVIGPGGPVLDLLGGDALSNGGTPRNSLEFNGGLFRNGIGLFAQGSWNQPTRVRTSGLPGASNLRFGALTKVNLNLFVGLDQVVKDKAWAKGMRFSIRAQNLFDSRQRVTDASGTVPLSYQPDRLDPRGRFIEIDLRKMF